MYSNPAVTRSAQNIFLAGLLLLPVACDQNKRSSDMEGIVQADPELVNILEKGTRLEKLASGVGLLEGPVWGFGHLLFSEMRSHETG